MSFCIILFSGSPGISLYIGIFLHGHLFFCCSCYLRNNLMCILRFYALGFFNILYIQSIQRIKAIFYVLNLVVFLFFFWGGGVEICF